MARLSVPSRGRVQMGRCGQGSFLPCTAGGSSSATVAPWPPQCPFPAQSQLFFPQGELFPLGRELLLGISVILKGLDHPSFSVFPQPVSGFHVLFCLLICELESEKFVPSFTGCFSESFAEVLFSEESLWQSQGRAVFWWFLDSLALGTVRHLFSPPPPHLLPQHSCWFCVYTEECYTWCDPTYCSLGFVEIPFHLVLLKMLSVLLLLPKSF